MQTAMKHSESHAGHCCHGGARPKVQVEPPKSASPDAIYTCPMHPEIEQAGPGACPKCGMALEPALPVAATRTEYICPMHPEIVRSEPGSCPICGMALEPRTVSLQEGPNPELVDMT